MKSTYCKYCFLLIENPEQNAAQYFKVSVLESHVGMLSMWSVFRVLMGCEALPIGTNQAPLGDGNFTGKVQTENTEKGLAFSLRFITPQSPTCMYVSVLSNPSEMRPSLAGGAEARPISQ